MKLSNLLRPTERKPNFDMSSLPFAISVPTHGDTGKCHHSCKDTQKKKKWPPRSKFFRGIRNKWSRICREQSRTSGSRWAFLPLICCFRQNQSNNESETNL